MMSYFASNKMEKNNPFLTEKIETTENLNPVKLYPFKANNSKFTNISVIKDFKNLEMQNPFNFGIKAYNTQFKFYKPLFPVKSKLFMQNPAPSTIEKIPPGPFSITG